MKRSYKNVHVKEFRPSYVLPEDMMAKEYGGYGTKLQISDDNQLLKNISIYWYSIKMVGMLPIGKSSSGKYSFRVISLPMVYSVLVFIFYLVISGFQLQEILRKLFNPNTTFYEVAFGINVIVFLAMPIILTCCHWLQARQIADELNLWMKFQIDFHRVTSHPLQISLKKQTLILYITTLATMAVVLVMGYFLTDEHNISPHEAVYLSSIIILIVWHFQMWHFLLKALIQSVKQLIDCICSDTALISALVSEYSSLWLSLAHLSEGIGHGLGLCCGACILESFVIFTLSSYAALYSLIHGHYSTFSVYSIYIFLNGALITLLCSSAENATNQLGDTFLTSLCQMSSNDINTQCELDLFIRLVASDKPTITLAGFVTAGRKLQSSIVATVVTYLIILIQFDSALNSEPEKNNRTEILQNKND